MVLYGLVIVFKNVYKNSLKNYKNFCMSELTWRAMEAVKPLYKALEPCVLTIEIAILLAPAATDSCVCRWTCTRK